MSLLGIGKWHRCSSLLILASFGVWPVFGAAITVANTNDSGAGSLRDAIASASPGDTINFGVTGTIAYASPFYINKNLTIIRSRRRESGAQREQCQCESGAGDRRERDPANLGQRDEWARIRNDRHSSSLALSYFSLPFVFGEAEVRYS